MALHRDDPSQMSGPVVVVTRRWALLARERRSMTMSPLDSAEAVLDDVRDRRADQRVLQLMP